MSHGQEKRRRRSDEEIRQLAVEFVRSGKSRQEFAEQHGVSPSCVDNWRRRAQVLGGGKVQETSRLVPVRVESRQSNSEGLEIRVNDQWVIGVPDGFDEETLRRLLEVLAKAC